ncbi:MAG: hypothetical protein AB7F43_12760 [Bacteriovoracia bacterium]
MDLPIQVSAVGFPNSQPGTIQVRSWNSKERMTRALKYGGMCWAIGICCIVLPIVHFILVPAFLIAGPIVALVVYKREKVVLGGEATCPSCQKKTPISKGVFRFPTTDTCDHCRCNLMVDLKA